VARTAKRKTPRRKSRQKPDAVDYAYERYVGDDPKARDAFEEHLVNAEISRKIHDLRTKAGLSQRELARRVGTTASVICQLENADYQGHSLSMLKRIAAALGKRVEIRFRPLGSQKA
jgi:ribosome-binding protein aMBF1 (putative translation factor)